MQSPEFIQGQINELQQATAGMDVKIDNALERVDSNQQLLEKVLAMSQDRAAQHDRIERLVLSLRASMPTEASIDAVLSKGLAVRATKVMMGSVAVLFTGFIAYVFDFFKSGPHT